MRRSKQFFKRAMALLLSLLIAVSGMGTFPVIAADSNSAHTHTESVDVDNVWNSTTASLVAGNYELNEYEQAILACSGLAGVTYAVDIPTSETNGLVSVDADAQTVTAHVYTTKDGFVWKPTAAVLKYTAADGSAGTDIVVDLTANAEGTVYTGRFQKPSNSYRAEVTYSLYIAVDADLQQQLLNTPYYLADGVAQMNFASSIVVLAIDNITAMMDDLKTLYDGIEYKVEYKDDTLGVEYTYEKIIALEDDSVVKAALGELIEGSKADGKLTALSDAFATYSRSGTNKVQFIIENGQSVKDNIGWFYTQLLAISDGSGELLALADELDAMAESGGDIDIAIREVENAALQIEEATEDAVQQIVKAAADKVEQSYGSYVSIRDLQGKSRDELTQAIDDKIASFEQLAKSLDILAPDMATALRNEGIPAMETLKTKVQEVYTAGDAKAAEVRAKKSDLEAVRTTVTDKAAEIRSLIGGSTMNSAVAAVGMCANATWEYLAFGNSLLKDTITAEEYAKLDTAVLAAVSGTTSRAQKHDNVTILPELFAAEAVITAMVDQYVVYVDVKANVVDKTSTNTSATITLDTFSVNFPMDKDTAAADILAAITASGVEDSALSQWDPYYNVGAAGYNRTVTITDIDGNAIDALGALTEDIRYTISYTPKTFVITETYKSGDNTTEVPYGYNWVLPRPADLSKSYDYKINGITQREGTTYRVVENIKVERSEGKAVTSKNLATLIAESLIPGTSLSDKEKAVLKTNAFKVDTVYFRTPDSTDKLAKVTAEGGNNYKVTAETMNSGHGETVWVPVSAYPVLSGGNGTSFVLTKADNAYEGTFTCDESFATVQVTYQLAIELDGGLVSDLANIADVLADDMVDQKAVLDALCTKNNFYNNLGQVNKTILGSVGSVASDMSPAAKEALGSLTSECFGVDSQNTLLYEYLTEYMGEKGGLAYYYKGNNAANIREQIRLVNTYLPIVWNDPAIQAALGNAGFADKSATIEAVMEQLAIAAQTLEPVNALVDTDSVYIDNLVAAVMADGTTGIHSGVSGTVTMQTVLSAVAPGQTSYIVEIQVLNKNDGVVQSYKAEAFRAQGEKVTAAEFRAMYDQLLASIPNGEYYVPEIVLPSEDVLLGEDPVVYISAMRPVTYTVKIDGEADQTLYAFDAYTITLPGTGANGSKYVYTIGSATVDVLAAAKGYSLATSVEEMEALFGADRELTITRKLVDTNRENLLSFVDKLNNMLANANFTFGEGSNQMAVAFIPVEDTDGNLSIVLRVTSQYANVTPSSLANDMAALIQDLSYVGLNGNTFFGLNGDGELKLHLQAMINMMTNSGLGLDSLGKILTSHGDIVEMEIKNATVIGADNNDRIVLDSGKIINDVDALGGKLIESTMQYGVSVDNNISVPFYVTYQDFDAEAAMLSKLKKGIDQIVPYANFNLKDGALNLMLNAPDSAYAYLMTAMLAVGQVDFETLQSYDLKDDVLSYCYELIKPMFESEEVCADTLINTLDNAGFYSAIANFDTEANKALINFLYNAIDHLHDSTSEEGTSENGLYKGTFTYDALDVLFNQRVELEDYKNMVAELENGLTLNINFEMKNRDTAYQALVLDVKATGITNKYYMSRNAAAALSKAGNGAVVILLADIKADSLVINNDIVLNLNGNTVNADLIAKGTVTIVDSTLSTTDCGSVTGKLSTANGGTFKLGSGKYLSGAEAYLEAGYSFANNSVTNGCFTTEEKDGVLNIYLGKDYLLLDRSAAKVMATDVLLKLLMNYYACSEMTVDGNTLYSVDLKNITESLNTLSVLVDKFVECVNCEGASAFMTQFMTDVTSFGKLADALENDTALVSYTLQNAAFSPSMEVVGEAENSYFSFNVTSADEKKTTQINVLIAENVTPEQKDKAVAILDELETITTFDALSVGIEDLAYGSNGFSVAGSAMADVTVDLTNNVNYPIIIAAILADSVTGSYKTELVDAIKIYQAGFNADALKIALEKMTTSQLITALSSTKSKHFTSILTGLGLEAPEAVELESLYTIARKVAGTIVEASKKTGGSSALGGLRVADEYGVYSYRLDISEDTYAALTLKLFSEEQNPIVVVSVDGVKTYPETLVEALANVQEGDIVYISGYIHGGKVVLTADVTLPAVTFEMVYTKNIDFNGKTLIFNNSNTKLTADADIYANLKAAEMECNTSITEISTYVYQLQGGTHAWEKVEGSEPTCTDPGKEDGEQCKHCGAWKDGKEPAEIPANGHSYDEVVTAPTCTERGYTTYTCSACGDSYVDDYVAATNHEGTTVVLEYKAPTCTEDGLTEGLHCTACGTTLVKQEGIPAGHIPEEVEKAPTCTEDGIAGKTVCKVCGETIEEGTVIPATGHGVAVSQGTEPTCNEPGLTAGAYCPNCDHVFVPQEIIPALGHDWVDDVAVEPTCTTSGLTAGKHCERCGEVETKQEGIPVKDHTPEEIPAVKPTENAVGYTAGSKCSVCGKVLSEPEELAKLPYIDVPEVDVDADDGLIRGAYVDAVNRYIYLDVAPSGLKTEDFGKVVAFMVHNYENTTTTLYDHNGNEQLVCTGDTVTVWAENKDRAECRVTYTIIIMGDANCDGKANSRDTVLMEMYYIGEMSLEKPGYLAADMNRDGKINSRDTTVCKNKYVLWDENTYVSLLK